ncbi:MAG: phosphodiester glycosidase family protein [Fidelibacterota bacterium]
MHWKPIDSLNTTLPPGIKVFKGRNETLPLNAWYLAINEPDSTIRTHVVVSEDDDRRETLSSFALRWQAPVVVNGGYFLMHKKPTNHVGLLFIDGKLVEPALPSLLRGNEHYFTARGALGFTPDDRVDIAWVSTWNDSLFEWSTPPPNRPGHPVESLDRTQARYWPMQDALHAGPVLIHDGKINITVNEEVFFDTKIPDVHPRTAVGYRSNGELILLVVDGRQVSSRGVDLNELATILLDLGCYEALNLDGGGSSALVVNGNLLNRPAGGTTEREVMSALVVLYEP